MYRSVTIFMMMLAGLATFAQTHVCDSVGKSPVEGAIVIGNTADGKTLFVGSSDEHGRITIDRHNKLATLTVSRMGYKTHRQAVSDDCRLPDTLFLAADNSLPELTVTYSKELYNLSPDRFVYHIDADSAMRGKTAFDALYKVPLLEVKRNGEVRSANGKSIVYKLNGLKNPLLTTGTLQDVLLSLPADALKISRYHTNTRQRKWARWLSILIPKAE